MCGILASISVMPRSKKPAWFEEGLESINHRGPDGTGTWWSRDLRVGLGHKRLSIIDLSDSGAQPMHDENSKVHLTFNGEIYNYLILKKTLQDCGYNFKSRSDTEVLLKAYIEWGDDFLVRLQGMFSFVLYDERKNKIIAARDIAGEKPLFYLKTEHELIFCSELKGILKNKRASRKVDFNSLGKLLYIGFVPDQECILEGYKKLPPGHVLTFNLKTTSKWTEFKIQPFWTFPLPAISNLNTSNSHEMLEELNDLLCSSVEQQLIADVPLGILLSGGLDSSLISAIAAKQSKINTFSVGFPSSHIHDETEYARKVARHIGSEHHELMIEQVQPETLQTLALHFDEPIIDSSMIPTFLISKMVREYCKVVLGGDGADELFGGYPHYNKWLSISKIANKIPLILRKVIALSARHTLAPGFTGRNYLSSLDINLDNELPKISEYFDQKTIQLLFSKISNEMISSVSNSDCWKKLVYNHSDLVQRFSLTDFRNYLTEDILVKVDRASMANSLEVRSPFLDKNLIEFALGKVPSFLKFDDKNRKILLSKLAKRYLPNNFDLIRKQGFSIPKNLIFENKQVLTFIFDTLSNSNSIFEKSTIKSLIKKESNRKGGMERVFTLCQLNLWAGQHEINF